MQLTGAQALIKSLEMEGTEVMFGLPGGAILPVYDPLIDSSIRHILVRHEQGAGHMAEGYAHATGRPGVAMVTSGPAATNIVTPLCDAYMDSIPLVVDHRPGAVRGDRHRRVPGVRHRRHHDAGHQAQLARSPTPPTSRGWSGRRSTWPRPAVPARCSSTCRRTSPNQTMDWYWPEAVDLPGYKPTTKGHPKQIKDAARLMGEAQRPVIYAGGGILKARAAEALRELVELTGFPVVTTLMARGAFPDDHELCLGMPGMHGNYTAVTAMQQSDLLIALGLALRRPRHRQGRRVRAGRQDHPRRHRPRRARQGAPARRADRRRLPPRDRGAGEGGAGRAEQARVAVARRLAHAAARVAGAATRSTTSSSRTARSSRSSCIDMLRDNTPDDTIVASGVGQHQMWTSQRWKFNHPYTWVNSGGLGTMGFAVPAAIGAKVGKPERMVWAVDGDGCFQMTAQELVTASAERIPVKIAILNNAYLGMVRQWQELFYEERYSEVYLSPDLPDYVKWAEAMGCVGFRVDTPEDVVPTIEKANEIDDRPVVIDFRTDYREKVYPMVAPGTSNDDVILDPAHDTYGERD